ncbi:class I SAM-dependent methyltransferase [Paractinoplanes lichenicola]|uniref:Class I SAM-dependent methyltransferase n=1 Tax=Paractinoplanes lichenicola TaxID=2802976 RepID=A0ABS1VZJ3_9ACTN|nr:class I SAM-dependent methyltransferase [Actinoplanes lichenicola]MBL7259894.1 class I SAM-dependent methyltransferase [Actinoplanes lichenicola]
MTSWRKYLLIPRLTLTALGAPRDQTRAWDRYWTSITRTGPGGDVLWEADEPAEHERLAAALRQHAALELPMVDFGCGSGRRTHELAGFAPRVIGVDGSAAAIARASGAEDGRITFRVADIGSAGLGERLHDELGDANVHIRGVLHLLDDASRQAVARNVAALLGARGTLCFTETDHAGDPLDLLLDQGARPTRLPPLVDRLIRAGVRAPRRFGAGETAAVFPRDAWEIVEQGPTEVYGVPLEPGGPVQRIPAWRAVIRRRRRSSR